MLRRHTLAIVAPMTPLSSIGSLFLRKWMMGQHILFTRHLVGTFGSFSRLTLGRRMKVRRYRTLRAALNSIRPVLVGAAEAVFRRSKLI